MQLSLFSPDRLPRKPYCTNDLDAGLVIRQQSHALLRRYIQPNAPAMRFWMVFDVDRESASEAWDGVAAEPNFTVINPANGHAHLIYGLDVPICTSDAGRLKPLRYAAAIEGAYTHRLRADNGYTGLICKNPLHCDWKLLRGPEWAYGLSDLAAWVPNISRWKNPSRVIDTALGRNCQMFDALRSWAYRHINRTAWVSRDAWHRAVEIEAVELNSQFPVPLPWPEVKATAKSVAKWVWEVLRGSQAEYVARTHTPEIQAFRGKRGGIASGESRRKGTPLEHDPEPWLALGISRATWYRRQQQTLFEPDSPTEK